MKLIKENKPNYYTGKPVHHNPRSGQTIYEYEGKFYFHEQWGLHEFDTLDEAILVEARIDPRMGWN